ncbi:hypothetical protein MS3_00002563 [Schistosoma haematobium]|uniref:Uncharacterized protein n=1 Tax=Schistosoma haematobium TaxID=6185 RepID=A0A922LLU1_SCHHA|nr:hypothetical protein MS3_00002563 [Schistosoma haematobium]KAH9589528.1 hypothetical protein MS3_00002563 [Schistosoma haematobium]
MGSLNPCPTPLLYPRLGQAVAPERLQMSTQNTSDSLARYYQQQSTMGEEKPDSNRGRNQEESLEMDRTRIDESTQLYHNTSPHLKSSNPKEKRKTKEQITP